MLIPKLKYDKFTYSDYLAWDDQERWEIINGIPYNMSPAPYRKHQKISTNLSGEFYNYLKGKKCTVYVAPFDVRFAEKGTDDELIETVVQPDISIFCDPSKLDKRGAIGAPDLIVEILSLSTFDKDINLKFKLYQKHKVQEYWIVDPDNNTLKVYQLDKQGTYQPANEYGEKDKVKVGIFPDLEIDLCFVFEE